MEEPDWPVHNCHCTCGDVSELLAELEQCRQQLAARDNHEVCTERLVLTLRERDKARQQLAAAQEERRQLIASAFDAIDTVARPTKHFTKYPCLCGATVSNSGLAGKSHLRGKAHREALARLDAAQQEPATTGKKYLPWAEAGGPNECTHGYAEGIPCPRCDEQEPATSAERSE